MSRPASLRCRDPLLLGEALAQYETVHGALPGIASGLERASFVEHLVECGNIADSLRLLAADHVDGPCSDPDAEGFNPLCAAVAQNRRGNTEEACWLAFLAVAFGESPDHGWHMATTAHRRPGEQGMWDWDAASSDVPAFREWIQRNRHRFVGVSFGNHRKRESLNDRNGFGETVETYVLWVREAGTHAGWIDAAGQEGDPFDLLYRSMRDIRRFGRLARFDFLCCLEALSIIDFAPTKAYLQGATGPLAGARRLYGRPKGTWGGRPFVLDERLIELEEYLNVGFDVLEDALCEWQKRPGGTAAAACGVRGAPRSCRSAVLEGSGLPATPRHALRR